LRFRLDAARIAADSLVLDDSARPLLLSTRALQELRGAGTAAVGSGPAPAPAPDPADAVEAEQAFGQQPAAGALLAYARADHTHGTPSLPKPDGDVIGEIADNRIARLQGQTVDAPSPENGDVLSFDKPGKRWVARPPPRGGEGGPVRIVAGGLLSMSGPVGLTLGGLKLVGTAPLRFTFDGYAAPKEDGDHNYVVKALAAVKLGQPVPVIGFGGFHTRGIELAVGIGGEPRPFDDDMQVMVEVTEIRRPPPEELRVPDVVVRVPRKTRVRP
jgi:hypothetical protein